MIHANDNGRPISFISMFSGIEAASVAFGPLGWKPICFAEIEKFPSAVLAHHYPDVPNVGDMSKHDWAQYAGKVDIVCGGPPCQDFSIAGLRAGLDGARGNLSITYMRALHAIKPRNAVVENVPGWLNDKKNAFGCFLAGLVGADDPLRTPDGKSWPNAGMVAGPLGRAAWRVLDAQYFGVAQRRRRVIVVADFGNGADPATVLFEQDGLRRHSPPSREAGKDVAGAAASGAGSCGWPADVASTLNAAFGEKLGLENQHINSGAPLFVPSSEVAPCLRARGNASHRLDTEAVVAVSIHGDIAHTLKAEGADASEDGTGRGTPIIAFDTTQITSALNRSVPKPGDPCHPLNAQAHPPAICFTAKDYGADAQEEISPTLRSGNHSGSHANGGVMPAIAFQAEMSVPQVDFELSQTLQATNHQAAAKGSAVRRLTPMECERLQGFPDGYTNIPWRGKPDSPDGPRYKALGNSWAVPKFVWLGHRLQHLLVANDNHKRSSVIPLAA